MEQRPFDRYIARGADRPRWAERFHVRRARRLAQEVAPTSCRVLEIGPGDGLLAAALVERGNAYTGLDRSPAGATELRSRGFDVRVAEVPPFPSGAEVDVIVASHVIEHLASPSAVVEFLREGAARLRPGGQIFLLYPDARRFGFDFWESDYTHIWPSTARRVSQAAADAGLKVVGHSRRCASLTGMSGEFVFFLSRLLPLGLLERIDDQRAEFWYRGRLLLVPEVLTQIAAAEVGEYR